MSRRKKGISTRREPESWQKRYSWKKWLALGLLLFGLSAKVRVLEGGAWLSCLETAALDAVLVFRNPEVSRGVVIVGITDEDYRDLFQETSPLAPEALYGLLNAIALGSPRVIGVDLDTSAGVFRELQLSPEWPPVVWAQSTRERSGRLEPVPVLGGRELQPLCGIAASPMDLDCRVRRYRQVYETEEGALPSFARAITAVWKGEADRPRGPEKEVELNLFGAPYEFEKYTARDVLAASRHPGWGKHGPLGGKVVLLGGLYQASRDVYHTPWGRKFGVEIMAHAVESDLRGKGIRPVHQWTMVGIEVFAGLLIVYINRKLPVEAALRLSLRLVIVLAPLASLLLFSTLAYWASFVPILAMVILYQLYEQARNYRKLLEQAVSGTSEAHVEKRAPRP